MSPQSRPKNTVEEPQKVIQPTRPSNKKLIEAAILDLFGDELTDESEREDVLQTMELCSNE